MPLEGKHFAFKKSSSTSCEPHAAPKDRKKMQEGVFVKEKYFKSILKLIVATFQVKVSIITC